jgi:ketosteroid isomerase-like protein
MNPKPLLSVCTALISALIALPLCGQSSSPVAPNTPTSAPAATPSDPSEAALFQTIKALDAKLFDAYNHCDLKTLGEMVTDDLEFYHDQTGLMVGKAPFLAAIQQNICGKVQRALLPATLEVYPLKNYGAVEIGIHRFSHVGHPEDGVGDAKFITLWQNKDGVWKVTRVISYEHNHGLLANAAPCDQPAAK